MSNHPIDQPGSHALGSDSSYATPPLRSRDKFFGLLGIPKYKAKIKAKTSSQSLNTEGDEQVKKSSPFASQASAFLSEDYHSVSASVAEDKFLPVPPAEKGQPLLNVFPENMSKPVIRTKLPALQDRIEMTQQLVYCHSLLLKGSAATTINDRLQGNDSQESVLDETERAWVRVVQQNSSQQHHLRWLVTKIVKEFAKDDLEGPDAIAEAVILGSVLDRATYRSLISCFITKFEQATILDIALLQGLVQLIESASSGYLQDDDLVRTLGVLRRRLRGTHKQSSEHVCQMTLAISRLLDVMVNGMVKDLNRTVDHQPLMAILTELKDTSDPILHFQVAYALQALQYVPDDESTLQAVLRFAGGVAMAALGVASICKLDPANLFNSLDTLRQAAGQSYEVTKSFLEGMEASQRGRFGAMQSLLKGIRAGTRHEWYLTLLAAKSFVRDGRLADFKRTVCDAPCRDECAFQLGVCQILGDIAMDPLWDSSTRHQAIDFLGALHRNIIGWKQYSDSKEWIFSILTQMSGLSDEAVKEHAAAALQDLGQEDATITSMSFPLKSRLSLPELSPLLTSIHQIPDVEHHLHKVQLQRLEEVKLPVYIPPMAKANLQAKDEDLFSLMEKVEEFLSSDRQVALILGDSGAGKSTFNKHLEKELLQSYQSGGRIPLFVNLPALDRPDKDLMTEQLRAHNFSDAQIQELKLRREFIVICDGYDESQLICNLHTTNNFNRPGQWKVKLVISCRTQYLGPDYQDRFVPKAVDQYQRAASDLFQEAIIAPFSKNQIETYVEKYIPLEPRTWVKKDYMDKLTAIPHLMDMVKNPFLLTIALEALPGVIQRKRDLSTVRITRVQLYDIFVEHWLGVNKRRLQGQNLSGDHQRVLDELLEDGFEENGIKFQKELATAIFVEQEGRPVVDYVHKRNKDTWKAAFFRPDPEPTLLRNACLLNRAGTQYRFMHRSVLEYFYSRHIYDSIVLDENPSLELPTESTTPIVSQPLSQMNLVAEPSITEFLAERVQSDPAFKQQLLAIIELSKTDASTATAAANAITILVKAKVRFNASDLRGIRIPGADLSGGQFDSAQFQRADLIGANLTRSWIRQADFSNARMKETHFGELPYLKGSNTAISCAYAPDGKTFAVGLDSKDINIYDTTSWAIIHQFVGHKDSVRSITFSPCGKHLLSGSDDKTARLWDCQTKELLFVLEGHIYCVYTVAYSPSGKKVASAGYDSSVRVWDPETGALVFELQGHTDRVDGLAFSPDGLWLASGSLDETLRFHDTQRGTPGLVLDISHWGIGSIAFSPIDQRIAVGHQDGHMQLCDTTTGEILLEWSGHSVYISGVTFSTDGQWIATASYDQTARLWDAQTGSLVSIFAGHSSPISSVAFSPNGSQLATGGRDNTMRLWELNLTGPNPDSQDKSDPVVSVAYSHDGQWVVSGKENGVVQQYNAVTGESGFVYPIHLDGASFVAFSPTSHQFVSVSTTSANEVKVWNTDTGALNHVLRGHTDDISSLSFSSCGGRIASGSKDNTIRFWDACSGTLDKVLEGHSSAIIALAFSPDGRRLVSCDWDDKIRVWEVATGEFRILLLPPEYFRIKAIAYSPNGQQVALSRVYCMYIIDVQTGNVLHTLFQEPSVYCLQFSPCGTWLATGGYGVMILWRSASDGEGGGQKWSQVVKIEGLLGRVASIGWRPQNSSDPLEFVSGCLDGSVRVWRIVKGLDGGVSAQLVWGVGGNHLCASATGLVDVVGLSTANRLLLKQRGAIDGLESESEDDD